MAECPLPTTSVRFTPGTGDVGNTIGHPVGEPLATDGQTVGAHGIGLPPGAGRVDDRPDDGVVLAVSV